MFYETKPEKVLRFGDVIKGYATTDFAINEPVLSLKNESLNYKINIEMPDYCVILTPCCEIGNSMISVSPLTQIKSVFLKNPYFAEDLLRINREMTPEQAYPPENLEKLSPEEKEGKRQYALVDCFVYKENEFFDEYPLRNKDIRDYMINFKYIYKIKCPLIKRPEETLTEGGLIINSKVLQLSVQTRKELRDKLAYYYGRTPKEDAIILG